MNVGNPATEANALKSQAEKIPDPGHPQQHGNNPSGNIQAVHEHHDVKNRYTQGC